MCIFWEGHTYRASLSSTVTTVHENSGCAFTVPISQQKQAEETVDVLRFRLVVCTGLATGTAIQCWKRTASDNFTLNAMRLSLEHLQSTYKECLYRLVKAKASQERQNREIVIRTVMMMIQSALSAQPRLDHDVASAQIRASAQSKANLMSVTCLPRIFIPHSSFCSLADSVSSPSVHFRPPIREQSRTFSVAMATLHCMSCYDFLCLLLQHL